MNVLHFIDSLSKKKGGPTVSFNSLIAQLNNSSRIKPIAFYGVSKEDEPNELSSNVVKFNYENNNLIPIRVFQFCSKFIKVNKLYKVDLVHIHGVWGLEYFLIMVLCCLLSVPFVISPRGALDPWCLKQKKLKKKYFFALVFRPLLQKSKYFICASKLEECSIKNLFPQSSVVVLSNINVLPSFVHDKNLYEKNRDRQKIQKIFIFVGRLSPVKGIDLLLRSWFGSEVCKNSILRIVGPDEDGIFEREIVKYANSRYLNSVSYMGAVFNEKKFDLIRSSDFLVLPSKSENFAMVVLEAIWFGIPVVISPHTPWIEVNELGLGKTVELSELELIKAFNELSRIEYSEWEKMRDACMLYRTRFIPENIVKGYEGFYLSHMR